MVGLWLVYGWFMDVDVDDDDDDDDDDDRDECSHHTIGLGNHFAMDASTLHGVKPESHEGAWDGGGETNVITRTKRTTDSTKVHPGIGVKVVT